MLHVSNLTRNVKADHLKVMVIPARARTRDRPSPHVSHAAAPFLDMMYIYIYGVHRHARGFFRGNCSCPSFFHRSESQPARLSEVLSTYSTGVVDKAAFFCTRDGTRGCRRVCRLQSRQI